MHYTLIDPVNLTESLYKCQETLGVHTPSFLCYSPIVLPQPLHSTLMAMRLPTSAGSVSGFGLAPFHYRYVAKLGKESKLHLGKEVTEES